MDDVKGDDFLVYLWFVLWFLTIRQKNHLPDTKGLICTSHLHFKHYHSLEKDTRWELLEPVTFLKLGEMYLCLHCSEMMACIKLLLVMKGLGKQRDGWEVFYHSALKFSPTPRNEQGIELDGKALLSEWAGRSRCVHVFAALSNYRNVTGLTSWHVWCLIK